MEMDLAFGHHAAQLSRQSRPVLAHPEAKGVTQSYRHASAIFGSAPIRETAVAGPSRMGVAGWMNTPCLPSGDRRASAAERIAAWLKRPFSGRKKRHERWFLTSIARRLKKAVCIYPNGTCPGT
jgi:hypothetical protein